MPSEKLVLYVFVVSLLHSKETLSNNNFICLWLCIYVIIPRLFFQILLMGEHLARVPLTDLHRKGFSGVCFLSSALTRQFAIRYWPGRMHFLYRNYNR